MEKILDLNNLENITLLKPKFLELNEALNTELDFENLNEKIVQNSHCQTAIIGGLKFTKISSNKRFKIYNDDITILKILDGNGFIKWSKGEFDYKKDDKLAVISESEFELNGKTIAILINKN